MDIRKNHTTVNGLAHVVNGETGLGHCHNISLCDFTGHNAFKCLWIHEDGPSNHCLPQGLSLFTDIHHLCPALLVEVGKSWHLFLPHKITHSAERLAHSA